MKQKKILFVYQNFSSFVSADYEILSLNYLVTKYQFSPTKGLIKTFISLFYQLVYLLINFRKYDAVYIWFADYFSLFPILIFRIFNKKAFLVIGGYDVCRIPQLKYGVFTNQLRGFFAIVSMRYSSINITVSGYVDRKVKYISPHAKRHLIYNCVKIVSPSIRVPKEKIFLSVAFIESSSTFHLKGIDTFIELAKLMSDYQFIIIGISKMKVAPLLSSSPENLNFIDKIPHDNLHDYYNRAMFYCQFSRSESFGIAVAESMLLGCIPLITNEGGLKEIVGEHKYVMDRSPSEIKKRIAQLLNENILLEENKRKNRIVSLFSFEGRKKKINQLIVEYLT